jgi:hypothetical protein
MFKLQSRYKSLDINKNLEQYKFYPKQRNITNYQKSFSEDKKEINKEKTFNNSINNKNNKILPIYFYRKINTPYKYNITSMPEYLIKTNEEKRFVDKLYNSINNKKEKGILENLINKINLNTRKDYYKPKTLDIHNVLRYEPSLYPYSFSPENKNDLKPKNMKLIGNENKNDDNYKIDYLNTNPNNNSLKKEKNNFGIKIEIPYDKQIRYKYKLSDIFNLHDDSLFTNKSSEKYLYKNDKEKKENKFYTTSESNSDWIPNKINQKKIGTNSSVEYNIITPMYKGSNKFTTSSELNKDNFYNENPSFRRIKSISEFIDLTRVSATNTLECFNRKNKIPNFKFKNMVATNQADEYYYNRNIVDKSI